jgi:hypothetical protein
LRHCEICCHEGKQECDARNAQLPATDLQHGGDPFLMSGT